MVKKELHCSRRISLYYLTFRCIVPQFTFIMCCVMSEHEPARFWPKRCGTALTPDVSRSCDWREQHTDRELSAIAFFLFIVYKRTGSIDDLASRTFKRHVRANAQMPFRPCKSIRPEPRKRAVSPRLHTVYIWPSGKAYGLEGTGNQIHSSCSGMSGRTGLHSSFEAIVNPRKPQSTCILAQRIKPKGVVGVSGIG